MADIEDLENEEVDAGTAPQSQTGFNAAAFAVGTDRPNTAPLPAQPKGHTYSFLKNEHAAHATVKAAAGTPPPSLPSRQAHSHSSYRTKLSVMPMPELNNWQEILCAHARLNATGQPMDETGKVINLKDMHPKFGRMLAQTCLDLDTAGYGGQYYVLSGRRTHEEQAHLYHYYHSRGSDHPVALPGHSPHEWGLGTDLQYTGNHPERFYAAFHTHGRKNGLEFVKDDVNHCQIGDCIGVMAQMREQHQPTVMASNHKGPAASPLLKMGATA